MKEKEAEAIRKRESLPQEPEEKDPDACHIVMRMPVSGERVNRRFLKSESLSVLYDYAESLGPEKL